ncbi:DUF3422 family protein [Aliiroseovarius sp. YM-037]|uniref:DUF3422 family protein n=1 Tax=Aliiroseovarius sp. YM-037 TaxID=3341728 RepID=UPI003A80F2E7
MSPIKDHPLRYQLANELHARPFPSQGAPSHAIYLAIKRSNGAAHRDRSADHAHLNALLERHGVQSPPADATHFYGQIGRNQLKWESHSEFVTYTVFCNGLGARPFDPAAFEVFPSSWLSDAPGERMTSALIHIDMMPANDTLHQNLHNWFVPESLAVSHVLGQSATIAGDFRIDDAGHARFAVFVEPGIGMRRIGRIVQRVCEVETYKTMAMLGFQRARGMQSRMNEIDGELAGLLDDMCHEISSPDVTLKSLLKISSELEKLLAQSTFRFGATKAYEAIVNQRIDILREDRFEGRQTFAEFMMRRFDPAMRTVQSTKERLREMAARATRAGELLRTRVDVERSAQNQQLLESMNQRADRQLRLQKTVEGLSVVAISYYAVNLLTNVALPMATRLGIEKPWLMAGLTPLVIFGVWAIVRQIRKSVF